MTTDSVPLLIGEQVEAYGAAVRAQTFTDAAEIMRREGLPMSAGLLEAQRDVETLDRAEAGRQPVPTPPPMVCATCETSVGWVSCPTGGWWAHGSHPADGHDAAPMPAAEVER
ncbi:hypothetical protein ACWDN6_14675 [Streptomyces albogriseolus]